MKVDPPKKKEYTIKTYKTAALYLIEAWYTLDELKRMVAVLEASNVRNKEIVEEAMK